MKDKYLAAVTAAMLLVVAATALTAGGQRATQQPTATQQPAAADAPTGVTLHGVTVEQLQLRNTTVENATVDRLTVATLSSDDRTISNGTFVDAEIASLELPGVTAAELTGAEPPGTPAAANETTEAATPRPDDEQATQPAERISSVRIATLSVERAAVGSLTFEERNATTDEAESTDTPTTAGTPTEGDTPTGTPVSDLQNQAEGPQETPDDEADGAGQSVAVGTVNVTALTVEAMVVTTAVPNATAMEGTNATATNETNATVTDESNVTADQAQVGNESGAETTVAQLDVESATAGRVSARLTDAYGQFHAANVSTPDGIETGENYTVSITVVNADDERGVEYVGHRLGPTAAQRELLVLDPGERRTVTINVSAADLEPGVYSQFIETRNSVVTSTLTVANDTEAVGATPAGTPEETPTPGGEPEPTETGTPN